MIERLTCELGTIVVDDSSGNTKSVDDMMFDEIDHVGGLTSASGITSAHFEK